MKDLDCHLALMSEIASEEDNGHAALSQLTLDIVTIAKSSLLSFSSKPFKSNLHMAAGAQGYNRVLPVASRLSGWFATPYVAAGSTKRSFNTTRSINPFLSFLSVH